MMKQNIEKSRELEFAIFCIENIAAKLGVSAEKVYNALAEKSDILKFDSYSEEWLDFIMNCRREKDSSDYDIVMGGVANDKVFNTVELYFDQLIDKNEAISRLKYEKPNMQICFRTEESLEHLHYERSFEV